MRTPLRLSALTSALLAILAVGCDHSSNGGSGDMGDGGSNVSCVPLAHTCNVSGDCCVGSCDDRTHTCVLGFGSNPDGGAAGGGSCGAQGSACTSPIQCCGLSCVNGTCGAVCVQDGSSCGGDGECCGGNCDGGTCKAVVAGGCTTDNNSCTDNAQCCSRNCK